MMQIGLEDIRLRQWENKGTGGNRFSHKKNYFCKLNERALSYNMEVMHADILLLNRLQKGMRKPLMRFFGNIIRYCVIWVRFCLCGECERNRTGCHAMALELKDYLPLLLFLFAHKV